MAHGKIERIHSGITRRRLIQSLAAMGVAGTFLPGAVRSAEALQESEGGTVKFVFCLRRLPHLSRAEFQERWFDVHGPLVKERAEVLGILRYIQLHSLDDGVSAGVRAARQSPVPYDGIAELWWDSLEAFAPPDSSPERRRAGQELLEDERKFIDLPRSPVWLGRERPVVEGISSKNSA